MNKTSKRILLSGLLILLSLSCTLSAPAVVTNTLPVGDPSKEGIDAGALANLLQRAKDTHTDALVILKNGKRIGEYYFEKEPQPIETMSMTKSVVNLAIGRLIDTGKIKSLDEPVYAFYPEWHQGRKANITIRHLMNHTSGLQSERTTEEIYRSPDFVQLALAAELTDDPGSKFSYNNKAVNLLAGIVKRSSGLRLDRYLAKEVFTPLEITNFSWTLDRANNPHAMSGLQMKAIDLAKLGQLMIDNGIWNGNAIISQRWIDESTRPGQNQDQSSGLLWWLIPDWTKVTIDDATIQKWQQTGLLPDLVARLTNLRGGSWTYDEYQTLIKTTLGETDWPRWKQARASKQMPPAMTIQGPPAGFSANGYLGQFLIILPKEHLVAVRQIQSESHKSNNDDFADFPVLVKTLSRH